MNRAILDIHTHRLDATAALIAVDPRQFDPQPGRWYAVGYHPWHGIDRLTDADYDLLEQCAAHPQVLAIGETGMDTLRGATLDEQGAAFARHLQLARRMGLPVIVHNVRATQHILSIRHKAGLDDVVLAIHGMRGNEHVAHTLLDAGCYLSFGARFNPAALLATPHDRLLIETDEAPATIHEVAASVAACLHLTAAEILDIATSNAETLLTRP